MNINNSSTGMFQISDQEFEKLMTFIKTKYGIDLTKKKILIQSRLSSVLRERGLKDFNEYINLVFKDTSGKEVTTLLNKLTTNHSYFMREQEHFRFLASDVLPLITQKQTTLKELNIWSAGCSAGQEAYTTAMAIDEFLGIKNKLWTVKIFATDISMNVLEQAKVAVYSADNLKDVPPKWLDKYFEKVDNNSYKVCEFIRKQVVFKSFNLMEPFRFPRPFDLILCRNVMIYFDKLTKETLVEKFHQVTAVDGFLFIGHSEVIDKGLTKYKYIKPAIYQK
ncbi:MAG: protein-glutamate O-methyltransferase CheR [Oscillospiraceae bacterium]